MNKVILCGNLTKDPDVRYTQNGKAMARMSIAINQGYGDNKTTEYFNLVAWEKTAQLCEKYLHKGCKVLVEGRLKNNNYKDNKGVQHYAVDVIVTSLEFMDSKKKTAEEDEGYPTDDGRSPDDDMPF